MSFKRFKGQWDTVAVAAVILLAFSFAFGGASQGHAIRLALIELAALPLLVFTLGRLIVAPDAGPGGAPAAGGSSLASTSEFWRNHRFFLCILLGATLVPIIQVLPLPPGVWTALPGREEVRLALAVTEVAPRWGTLSLSPDQTWKAALALLPPAALALAILVGGASLARTLVVGALLGASVSILYGAAQLADGSGALNLWPTTGVGAQMTGLFANRNHLASLCLIGLPFAAVLMAGAIRRRSEGTSRAGLTPWLYAACMGLLVVALAAVLSRAGILLSGPVLAACLIVAWRASGRRLGLPVLLATAGALAVVAAVLFLAIDPILARFNADDGGRTQYWPAIVDAAQAQLPLGSGIGSFDAVYRSIETLEELSPTFLNRAHNDYLEIWLEAGWPGVALIVAFGAWFARRAWSAWRRPSGGLADLQRAATIAVAAVLAHSVADYPLRTVTLAVVFALAAALLELGHKAAPPREKPAASA